MKKILIITSICILPIFSYADSTTTVPAGTGANSPKYINDYIPYSDSRTYIDLNLGTMNAPFPTYDPQYPGQSPFNLNSQSSMTFNINAGYYFNPYFGVEGGLTHASISYSPSKGYDGSNYNSIAVAAKGLLPFTTWFSIYGKAGLNYNMYFTGSDNKSVPSQYDTGVGLLLGVGVQFKLVKDVYIHIENDYTMLNALSNDSQTNGAIQPNNPNNLMVGFEFAW